MITVKCCKKVGFHQRPHLRKSSEKLTADPETVFFPNLLRFGTALLTEVKSLYHQLVKMIKNIFYRHGYRMLPVVNFNIAILVITGIYNPEQFSYEIINLLPVRLTVEIRIIYVFGAVEIRHHNPYQLIKRVDFFFIYHYILRTFTKRHGFPIVPCLLDISD